MLVWPACVNCFMFSSHLPSALSWQTSSSVSLSSAVLQSITYSRFPLKLLPVALNCAAICTLPPLSAISGSFVSFFYFPAVGKLHVALKTNHHLLKHRSSFNSFSYSPFVMRHVLLLFVLLQSKSSSITPELENIALTQHDISLGRFRYCWLRHLYTVANVSSICWVKSLSNIAKQCMQTKTGSRLATGNFLSYSPLQIPFKHTWFRPLAPLELLEETEIRYLLCTCSHNIKQNYLFSHEQNSDAWF